MDSLTRFQHHIWLAADQLRGTFAVGEYDRVILPFVFLRRLDSMLASTREAVHDHLRENQSVPDGFTGFDFYNTSPFDFSSLLSDPSRVRENLMHFVDGFSPNVREVIDGFGFRLIVSRLDAAGLLYGVCQSFASIDLSESAFDEFSMGYLFDDLIRRFGESGNADPTPLDIASLMAHVLVDQDSIELSDSSSIVSVMDPCCRNGQVLLKLNAHINQISPKLGVDLNGYEADGFAYALAKSSFLLQGVPFGGVKLGNVLRQEFTGSFDYLVTHIPFGASWRGIKDYVKYEPKGRFRHGLPRTTDSALLHIQDLMGHMTPATSGGGRAVALINGSPLFAGHVNSGEAQIRQWLIESDYVEAVIALPEGLLSGSAVGSYLLILTNRKESSRRGKIQMINAQEMHTPLRKRLNYKRRMLSGEDIQGILGLYRRFADEDRSQIMSNSKLGKQRIVIERPLRVRWEINNHTVELVGKTKVVGALEPGVRGRLMDRLRGLVGQTHDDDRKLRVTVAELVRELDARPSLSKAILRAFTVRALDASPRLSRSGERTPDPDLRKTVDLPLIDTKESVAARFKKALGEGAWIDWDRTVTGYTFPRQPFLVAKWEGPTRPLNEMVDQIRSRSRRYGQEQVFPLLSAQDLDSVDFAGDLDATADGQDNLALCHGGDVVGSFNRWRHLPPDFGEALTKLTVLRPRGGVHAGTLAEWLNAGQITGWSGGFSLPDSLPTPTVALRDDEIAALIASLNQGRRTIDQVTRTLLPNVFRTDVADLEALKGIAVTTASQAHLLNQVLQPLEDPFWRAEWNYPFHVAVLARQYRLAQGATARRERILRLAEGITRVLGLFALVIRVRRQGVFSNNLKKSFDRGASFNSWLTVLRNLKADGEIPELPELNRVAFDPGGLGALLESLCRARNDPAHAHGAMTDRAIEDEVVVVEQDVMTCLDLVGWFATTRWEFVEQCLYLGEGEGFRLVGYRLVASHPDWERFERDVADPLHPDRIHVWSELAPPISFKCFARVLDCDDCRRKELFLFDGVTDERVTLRSLNNCDTNIPIDLTG
ncbi:HsdM family class I SAM-dependent methyltransferase [Actinocrispum wychmicini]|uniref:site-specific DNA-methyltransferase (adenine-specific) n=1 Tax=Actinocrispum wychmicini TaxID=1213861 RepID=A0A4V2S3V5_9PSEU|nr:class I SAM-dependent DNA methyltransferase [Actinocrispum wychmicini]TCO45870.1 type I restriction enzyme M protein [Actinocrispum wychmicini]